MRKYIFLITIVISLVSCVRNRNPQETTIAKEINNPILDTKHDNTQTIKSVDTISYDKAINTIKNIFEDYKGNEEAIDSKENKILMTKSITSLTNVTNSKDLRLLIDVWNYYDPTDYSCRDEIYSLLLQNKQISIIALKERIENKMKWENENLEGTEFKVLLKQLENEK